jgi:putative flavoprotein involved in K+ transport
MCSVERRPATTVQQVVGSTVIVGAGAGGLAVAAELRRRGLGFTLLEQAESIGASWRGRYDSLHLHTARWLSGLPGMRIPLRFGRWVRREDLIAYLERYAGELGIAPRFGVSVSRIERAADGWRVQTSDGTYEPDTVVLATGLSRTPAVPAWPGLDTFTGSFHHSAAYREPSSYVGRRVLVVGAGNSAAEIATELSNVADDVRLSVRTPPNIVRRDIHGLPSQVFGIVLRRCPERLLNALTGGMRRLSVPDLSDYGLPAPAGDGFTQYLRSQTVPILDHGFVAAVKAGRITVVPEIARIDGPAVELIDSSVLRPDAIVAATGFRQDLESLIGDLGVLDESGRPLIRGVHTMPSAPGLYLVGLTPVLSGLLREIGLEARAVGRAIASTQTALASSST